jgi:hypothetical protein
MSMAIRRRGPARASSILLGAAMLLTLAACEIFAQPALTCVDVDEAECRRQAQVIVDNAKRDTPTKRVVSITITENDGGEVLFDDGSAMQWIP